MYPHTASIHHIGS
jgi:hypothetical protein